MIDASQLKDEELIERLRHQASVWFKNDDIVLLEELIKRYQRQKVVEHA